MKLIKLSIKSSLALSRVKTIRSKVKTCQNYNVVTVCEIKARVHPKGTWLARGHCTFAVYASSNGMNNGNSHVTMQPCMQQTTQGALLGVF